MVLQALAHARQVVQDRHAFALQMRRIAHARDLQELRRIDRTGGQNHFFVSAKHLQHAVDGAFNAGGAVFVDDHAAHHGMGDDGQVRALHRSAQKGFGSGLAQAFAYRHLPQTKTLFGGAIEVGSTVEAQRIASF